jgi:hypothetical protein
MPNIRKVEWPTLEEQLAKDHIAPGSALEKVVRENQDLSLLAPGELNDPFNLPPWMRVFWRRHHPEMTGTYPLTVDTLYQWMVHFQDLPGLLDKKPGETNKPVETKKKGGRHGK